MEIYINQEQIPFELENEKNSFDIIDELSEFVAKLNPRQYIVNIVINGKEYSYSDESGLKKLKLDHIKKIEIETGDVYSITKLSIEQIENFLGRLNQGRSIERVNHLMTIHGSECWLNIKIQPWYTPFGKIGGYIMFVENVTEVQQARMRLSHLEEQENRLAYNDLLTGLPNRQLFYDRLNMALATAYRQLNKVGLMFLDLDGFKAVNDKLGHDVGDMLLKAVAERIQACVRETDTVSRLGGDEFTVIASVQNEQDFSLIAQKIIDNVNKPFDLGPHRGVHIGTSIGISLYPQHGGAANDLIRKADTAMYVAKNGGKNRFCVFEDSMIEEGEREDL